MPARHFRDVLRIGQIHDQEPVAVGPLRLLHAELTGPARVEVGVTATIVVVVMRAAARRARAAVLGEERPVGAAGSGALVLQHPRGVQPEGVPLVHQPGWALPLPGTSRGVQSQREELHRALG